MGNGSVLVYFLSQHIPYPGPRTLLCSTLYLQTSIWSTEQLSVELLMRKEIEELARPQEQLLEVHGWLGPDAWVEGENPQRSTKTSIKGSGGGHGQENGKEGQPCWLLCALLT